MEDFTDLDITWGVRCYNGAFDGRTYRMLDKQQRAIDRIREVVPDFSVTYFPVEGKYAVFDKYQPINMEWYPTRGAAIAAMYVHFVFCPL